MTQEALAPQDVDLYSPLDPSALPDEPVLLKKLLVQLVSLLRRETKRREDVERNMDLLLRKLTATRSESPSPDQLNLFVTAPESEGNSSAASAEPATEPAAEPEPKRKARPHGRRTPPAHLEEQEIVHDLPPELKRELGEQLVPLPDVVSFQYDYQAAKLVVLRHVQKKYLRRDRDLPAAPATADASLPAPVANPASIAHTTAPIADTVLEFTRTHERDGPARFLADYQGYLQADAYNGYDGIYLDSKGRIIEVGCWQHARKRYKKAAQSDARAFAGLAFIKSMYAIEKRIRELRDTEWRTLTLDERAARIVEIRQRDTAPLLQSFREWINKTHGDVLPKSDLGDAFRYTLNQWEALNEFAKCGLLSIDNNPAERAHRGIAIGRKNWLHVGSERGGHAAAIHFSLIASCKLNGLDPFAYLVDILPRVATTPAPDLGHLAPHRWTKSPAIPPSQ
jgi:hypothetical protein